ARKVTARLASLDARSPCPIGPIGLRWSNSLIGESGSCCRMVPGLRSPGDRDRVVGHWTAPPQAPPTKGPRVAWSAIQSRWRHSSADSHRRANFDKHAAYVVVAFVAGG